MRGPAPWPARRRAAASSWQDPAAARWMMRYRLSGAGGMRHRRGYGCQLLISLVRARTWRGGQAAVRRSPADPGARGPAHHELGPESSWTADQRGPRRLGRSLVCRERPFSLSFAATVSLGAGRVIAMPGRHLT